MRQAVFVGIGEIELREVPVPEPSGSEVLVRVESSGVCGTDRSFMAGTRTVMPPVVLGHEYSGTVVGCGPGVHDLSVGDRVVVDPNITCGRCSYCRRGFVNLCTSLACLGITIPGGYAEYSCVPETNAYLLPAGVSFDAAALTEPLACSIRGVARADIQLGDVVVILGAGPLGLLLAQLARQRGAARVIVSSRSAERRATAMDLGVDVAIDGSDEGELRRVVLANSRGLGADAVIEASGQPVATQRALGLVRPGGTVVLFGCNPQDARISVPPLWAQESEISIRGSYVNPFTHATAVTLLEAGRIRTTELIARHIGLDDLVAELDPGTPAPAGRVLVHPAAG